MKQSKMLTDFYQEMYEAVYGDIDTIRFHNVFSAHEGLCENLERYIDAVSCGTTRGKKIKAEMRAQFIEAGLDDEYPFNSDWSKPESDWNLSYGSEAKSSTMYQNPKRLKWIEDHSAKEIKMLTKSETRQALAMLRQAREKIENENESFICHAITGENKHLVQCLRVWISEMLIPANAYGGWLCQYHPEVFVEMSLDDRREGRIQWLDWMINEVKAGRAPK